VERYLRAAERYDPELVAHEVVQFFSGVRSDDEMGNFMAEYVLPQTKEIVIPAAISKMERRAVIQGIEENFWAWWTAYAPEKGLLRPKYHGPRWERVRFLSTVADQKKADDYARLPIKPLLARPEVRSALKSWPWNARRRTFCTYHVANYESAHKTALILRHHGSAETLHNSYRGLGITKAQGEAYFNLQPSPVLKPIMPSNWR